MKNLMLSSLLYSFCLVAIALYSLTIYMVGQTLWPDKTKGSLILDKNNNIRGSYLIAQQLKGLKYFKPRPNIEFNSECDIAIYNNNFKDTLIRNYDEKASHYDVTMMTTSSSKQDPFITKREAVFQALTVSKARGIDINIIYALIDQHALNKQKVFFELDIVNTSILNGILDDYYKN